MNNGLNQFTSRFFFTAGAVAVAALVAGSALAKETAGPPKVNVDDRSIDRDGRIATSYASVVKKVAPSVVNIYSTRTVRMQRFRTPFNDPFFRQFFGWDSEPGDNRAMTRREQSLGSGVIVSEDGYILTDNHVVEGADKDGVEVSLGDGKERYTARVVGTDPQTDVAVLKIEARKLSAITLTDSDKVEIGDVVLAIGNPFEVGQSVTMGIVSAVGRRYGILGRQGYEDFIQTDAAINPGNSGGALVDVNGRLIGINQSIASPSGANAGVGFAIPINLAKNIMDRIVTDGKVTRGYLGVGIQSVTPDLAKEFNLPDESGALVNGVQAGTPAADAGLKEGDLITEFNGKKVEDPRKLSFMVAQTAPKTKVTLIIVRDGKEKTVTATLAAQPAELAGGADSEKLESGQSSKTDSLDGVEVTDLDARARRQNDIPNYVRGALVTNVESGSAAEEAGLRPGDVITEINRQAVHNADDALELTRNAKGNRTLLRVWSNADGMAGTRYVVVDNSKHK
jgi:serine protease Do